MPYKDPEKQRANNNQTRKRRRADPEYVIKERERDAARAEIRLNELNETELEALLVKRRQYDRTRYRINPNYRVQQRAASKRFFANPENRARYNLKNRLAPFNMTPEDLAVMKQAQNNACALCDKPFPSPEFRKRNDEHIDHDHSSGRVRGILCGGCNTALGKLGDNVAGIKRALAYVSGNLSTGQVWVVEISTSSGDDYGAHLFTREPTGDELERYLKTIEPDETFHGDEENGCPGFRGSNFHISSYEGVGLLDPGNF